MTGSIDLDEQSKGFINEEVRLDAYALSADVVRGSLRNARRSTLHASLERGMADSKAGRVHDLDDVRAELVAKYSGR